MKRRIVLTMMSMATVGVLLCACGKTAEVAQPDVEKQATETEGKTEKDEKASDTQEKDITIKDIFEKNSFENILATYSGMQVDITNKQDDKVISEETFQIYNDNDDVKAEALFTSMDSSSDTNGGEVEEDGSLKGDETKYEGLESAGYYMYSADEDKSQGACLCKEGDFFKEVSDALYLPVFESYNFGEESSSFQDDALVVSARVDDCGDAYFWVDPDTAELWAINFIYDTGVTVEYSVTYDKFEKLGFKVVEDSLESGMCSKVTVDFDGSQKDYQVSAGTDVFLSRNCGYDLFSDEACTQESYIKEFTMGEEDVKLFAKPY